MHVTSAESLVMEALWRRHPLSAEEIIAGVGAEQGWSESTVKTLLARLVSKKAIAAKRDGRRFLYSPKLSRDDYVHAESSHLVDRLFEGRISSLVSHFSEREKLSAKEIAELKQLIAELENDR